VVNRDKRVIDIRRKAWVCSDNSRSSNWFQDQ